MVKKQPDWLPPGWKLQIKVKNARKFKCYFHLETCQKFYSKPAVLRYIKEGSMGEVRSNATKEHANKSSEEQGMQLVKANDSLKWLPAGWTVEVKKRQSGPKKGILYKCYIDPSTGSKFYSKPEVYRYLQSIQNCAGPSGQEERRSTRHSSNNRPVDQLKDQKFNDEASMSQMSKTHPSRRLSSGKEVIVVNTVDEDLPSGWIKEMRKRVLGTRVVRTDPFYFHPASGLVFRSKLDVLRYLKTGEISRHTYRRKNDDVKKELAIERTAPTPSVKREASASCRTGKEFFSGEETSTGSPSLMPKDRDVKEAVVKRITRSSSRVRPASVGEAKPDQSPLLHDIANVNQEMLPSRPSIKKETPGTTPSVQRETITNCRTGKELFPGEGTSRGNPSLMPKDGDVKEAMFKRITRSSSRLRPASVGEANPDQSSLLHDIANANQEILPSRLLLKNETVSTTTIISSEGQDADGESKVSSAKATEPLIQGCSNRKAQTSKRKRGDQKLHGVAARSSKRLAGVDVQAIFHSKPIEQTLRATNRKSSGAKLIPNVPTDLQDDRKAPDVDTQGVPVCQPAKHLSIDVGIASESMVATDEKTLNKSNSEMRKDLHVVDLHPGYSEDAIVEVPPINSERLLSENSRHTVIANETENCSRDHPILKDQPDGLLGKKVNNSLAGCPVPEEQPATVTTVKDSEQSGSEFSFPPPLWSDPCLEFAYKTLTGAIPLDDNLAIEDYIQHQLRTSKPSNDFSSLPDIDMPNFLQNDEAYLGSPSPGGTRLPNANSLVPPRNEQVKS